MSKPVWTPRLIAIAKKFEEDRKKASPDERKVYPSFSAYLKTLHAKTP